MSVINVIVNDNQKKLASIIDNSPRVKVSIIGAQGAIGPPNNIDTSNFANTGSLHNLDVQIQELYNIPIKQGYFSNISGNDDITLTGVTTRLYVDTYNDTNVFGSSIRGRRFRGNRQYPSGVLKDDVLLQLVGDGYSSGNIENATVNIAFRAESDFHSGNHPTYMEFYTSSLSGGNEIKRLHLSSEGNLGIQNYNPKYPLDVSGYANFTDGIYIQGKLFTGIGDNDYNNIIFSENIIKFTYFLTSGKETEFISYPLPFVKKPTTINCEFENDRDNLIYIFTISGVNLNGFYTNYSDILSNSGYKLNISINK